MNSQNLLSLLDVSYVYPSGDRAISHLSLDIPKGKKIALLGSNGAGKSTLMLLLNGILKPSEGCLTFESKPYVYKRKYLRELHQKVGILFQNSDHQLIAPTVYEEISLGLRNLSDDIPWVRSQVEKALLSFCIKDLEDKEPQELSMGQKKQVCLASIWAMNPKLIICDEPTSCLDPCAEDRLYALLDELVAKGTTVVVSTHDVNRAWDWCNWAIVLKKGEVAMKGIPQSIFTQKALLKECGLKVPYALEFQEKYEI